MIVEPWDWPHNNILKPPVNNITHVHIDSRTQKVEMEMALVRFAASLDKYFVIPKD